MSGYTHGPWRLELSFNRRFRERTKNGFSIFGSREKEVAEVRPAEKNGIELVWTEEDGANARLIATAPEQNESLRELLVAADVANELLQHLFPAVNVEEHNQIAAALIALTVARSKARHVIAKAEGIEEKWLAQVDTDPLYGQTESKGKNGLVNEAERTMGRQEL